MASLKYIINKSGSLTWVSQTQSNSSVPFLEIFAKRLWMVLIVAALIQCTIFFSLPNLFATACVLAAIKLTELFIFNKVILARYSLSCVVILGFSLTQNCLPLVLTLAEGKPIVFNLDLSYDVFFHSLLALIVLLLSHFIYRKLYFQLHIPRAKLQGLLNRAFIFTAPTDLQIWIMGIIGLAGMAMTYFTGSYYSSSDSERGVIAKVIQALIPFSYAPFFVYLRNLYDHRKKQPRKKSVWIIIYTTILIIVGIGGNSRALFMTGITAVGIAYFLGLLLGKFSYKIFTFKNIFIASIGFWVITGPLSELGTAMVVLRSHRTDISSSQLLIQTIDVYMNDKKSIRQFQKEGTEKQADWNEYYFDNIFLSRFCNLKYNDEGLKQYYKIGHIDEKMQDYSINKIFTILPAPVLSVIKPGIDKDKVNSASFGDYLFFRAGGYNALGGFRTGQMASTGMAAFGWWYLFILGLGIIPFFFLLDLFVVYTKNTKLISLAGLIPITSFFMFLSLSSSSESVVNIFTYIIRGWIQLVFLFWLIFRTTAGLSRIFKRNH